MSRHSNENPWRLSPSPPPSSFSSSSRAPTSSNAPIKGDSWRPKPSSSWTPATSRASEANRSRELVEDQRPRGSESYRPARRSPSPRREFKTASTSTWRDERRGQSRERRGGDEERTWAAWKDRRDTVDRRTEDRRRDGDRGWERRRSPERDRKDSFRPDNGRREVSPKPRRRASPDYGVGRRRSPSYTDRHEESGRQDRGRSRTPPKGLPYSPTSPRASNERKRPLSPDPPHRKRPRPLSPDGREETIRDRSPRSPRPVRSQPLRSPRNGISPRRRSPSPRSPPRRWRDRSPRRDSPRQDRSRSRDRIDRVRSRSPIERKQRESWGSRKTDRDTFKPEPKRETYRPQNGHPDRYAPEPKPRSSMQQFFEEATHIPSGPRSVSPVKVNGGSYSVAMDRVSSSGSGKSIPVGPRATHGPPSDAGVYLDRIAANEREYRSHLSSIAPYINAAFQSWVAQNASPALPEFLRHYFGRAPTMEETNQIESLLEMKMKLGRDEKELRGLAEQAEGKEQSTSHWSPPVNGTKSHSPKKPEVPEMKRNGTAPPPQPVERKPLPPGEIYERLNCVGEGTYGKVYKARNDISGQFVALKRIRMEGEKDGFPVTAMREIKLLQGLRHENVIRLIEMMVSKGSVYMVFEYMDHDLTGLLSHPSVTFTPANLKSLNFQMLSGLAYLHHKGILHRDMKGSNILLNAAGVLKLGDFGLARVYAKHRVQDYTNRVITLWYRSPELLLGETAYGPEVDMWSAGCIMLELFVTKPVFQGNDEIHQLEVIYSVMGTPSESDWPGVKELPWYELVKPKEQMPGKFRESFSKWLTPAALDLAEGLLFFDPKRRLSAASALKTAYFTSEDPRMEIPKQLATLGDYHEMDVKAERHRRRKEGESK